MLPQPQAREMDKPISLGFAEREFFLGIYRSAVNDYKPRIEKKTGTALGDIAVWEYSELARHLFNGFPIVRGPIKFLFRRRLRHYAENLREICQKQATKNSACYYGSAIYVSFDSGTAHEESVAATVIHELAHALWEKLGDRPLFWRPRPRYLEKYKLFVEGFATYAQKFWFLDLYPSLVRSSVKRLHLNPESVYYRGCCKVEEVVRQHGEQILMQIPKQWQSL
jgi:hypothetical protein